MESNKKNMPDRTPDDYARQQEDIRATQTHGESSFDHPESSNSHELGRTSEERERGQGVAPGTGKPL